MPPIDLAVLTQKGVVSFFKLPKQKSIFHFSSAFSCFILSSFLPTLVCVVPAGRAVFQCPCSAHSYTWALIPTAKVMFRYTVGL